MCHIALTVRTLSWPQDRRGPLAHPARLLHTRRVSRRPGASHRVRHHKGRDVLAGLRAHTWVDPRRLQARPNRVCADPVRRPCATTLRANCGAALWRCDVLACQQSGGHCSPSLLRLRRLRVDSFRPISIARAALGSISCARCKAFSV